MKRVRDGLSYTKLSLELYLEKQIGKWDINQVFDYLADRGFKIVRGAKPSQSLAQKETMLNMSDGDILVEMKFEPFRSNTKKLKGVWVHEGISDSLKSSKDMKRVKDNTPLMYKDNEQIEDMIFEKVSSLNMNDFDDRYYFHKASSEIGLNTQALDKGMSELGYSFVRETQPMGYDLCRIYQKDNIQTYVFLNLISGVDERGKNLKNIYKLVCANSYYINGVSDSRKIKDADETPDVLDGILMIAFNDGSEEEGYNEVKKHANEQGELDGVQYETYDTDNQDGVTLIDLCAATDDANAFVKALLTEWGIIDAVADIEFEKSELMENAEVSDSRKIKDSKEDELNDFIQIIYDAAKDHNLKVRGKQYWDDNTLEIEFGEDYLFKPNNAKIKIKQGSFQEMKTDLFSQISKWLSRHTKREAFANRIRDMYNGLVYRLNNYVSDSHKINDNFFDDNYGYTNDNEEGVEYNYAVFDFDECEMKDFQYESDAIDFCERNPYAASVMSYDGETIWIKGKGRVSDSKVEDMTKPAHLRGYAEKYRKKRREQKESYKENEEETQDKEVSDSRRIKDYVVGTKHPQEYFAELRWMLESLKKRGYIDAYLDDDIIKGFAEYYDYPSLREFNEWGDEEVAAGFNEYMETLE